MPAQLGPALVERDRFLERHLARFQPTDHPIEFGKCPSPPPPSDSVSLGTPCLLIYSASPCALATPGYSVSPCALATPGSLYSVSHGTPGSSIYSVRLGSELWCSRFFVVLSELWCSRFFDLLGESMWPCDSRFFDFLGGLVWS
jgi:hypothetical protein